MYCIYQRTHQPLVESIISNTNVVDSFVADIQDIVKNIYKIEYTMTEEVPTSNSTCVDGYYMIYKDNEITLVSKKTTVLTGFVYNSTNTVVDTVYTWKLIPFQIPVSCEIAEITEIVKEVERIVVSDDETAEAK